MRLCLLEIPFEIFEFGVGVKENYKISYDNNKTFSVNRKDLKVLNDSILIETLEDEYVV